MRVIEFDENDNLDVVLASFRDMCRKADLDPVEQLAAAELIATFHSDLTECSTLGNQARMEKVFDQGRFAIRVIAVSSQQRSFFKRSVFGKMLSWLRR